MRFRFLLLFYLVVSLKSYGQDYEPLFYPGAEYTLVLNDGTTLKGVVMEFQEGVVTLRTISGDFRVRVKDIRRIKGGPKKTSESNEKWIASPKQGNYVLGPSGIPLQPNEFDYQNVFLFLNSLNYGITNAVSIGAGFELISTALGHPIYYLNPRISIPFKKNLHVGGGIIFISFPTLDVSNGSVDVTKYYDLGVIYGHATLGTSDRNITMIAGYGLLNSKPTKRPTLSVSGVYRLSNKFALVSENWLVPEYYILSYGTRLILKRVVFDFTLINNHEWYEGGQIGYGIPFISVMIRLGKLD